MQKITIVGATSGFGEWLASYILENFSGVDLTITGNNEGKAIEASKKIGCKYNTNNIKAVKDADIVIFSVPIAYTKSIIEEVGPYIKSGALVSDVTSIKGFPSDAMKNSVQDDVLVIPTHPMFGPYIKSIAGQIIVLTPIKEDDKLDSRYIFLKNFLEKAGAKVIESNPKEHDKMMAVVQGLTHYNMFVLGETIKRLELDVEKSLDFVSPIYKIMLSSIGRYLYQDPKLYGDIQMFNEEVLTVHKEFMKVSNEFNKFVETKDEENFIKTIKGASKYFGENKEKGQIYTDKIIYLIGKQAELAEKNIGKEVKIINIYSNEEIKGVLENYKNEELHLDNGKKYDLNNWEIKITN